MILTAPRIIKYAANVIDIMFLRAYVEKIAINTIARIPNRSSNKPLAKCPPFFTYSSS